MARTASKLAVLLVFVLTPALVAGDGFPPFGAWVYGRGHAPVARVTKVRTVYRGFHPGWGIHRGWGSYGNLGFAATTRVRFGGWRYPWHHHHWRWHYRPYFSYRVSYPYFFHYRVAPVFTYPIYTYPITTYYGPLCDRSSISVSAGLAAAPRVAAGAADLASRVAQPNLSSSVRSDNSAGVRLAAKPVDTDYSARLVTTNLATAVPSRDNIPEEILQVADSMMRLGGYREAATAYARLASRHGSDRLIYGRRFVAQVASGDFAQAEVVLAMAEASGCRVDDVDFPVENPADLLPEPDLLKSRAEELAQRALQHPDDPLPLKSVATWLRMSGESELAKIFFERATQLEGVTEGSDPTDSEVIAPEDSHEQGMTWLALFR